MKGRARADVCHYLDISGSCNIVTDYYHKSVTPRLPAVTINGIIPDITLSSYTNMDEGTDYTALDY